nr:hypothetical protein GCM10020185_63760 [Pseudomonas brassicacearum subsp. brassicacearum]
MDVCLLPFKVMPLTLATNPVKVYEYLSAGKPVVSVKLPELSQFGKLVWAVEEPTEFISAIRDALDAVPEASATPKARQSFARGQTWQHRAASLRKAIATLPRPKVSVVVLTYNNLELTKACLDSLLTQSQYPNLEIIVVDNHSSDQTPAYLTAWAKGHPDRIVILNPDNKGFAAGNNLGLAAASGDYLVVLNNDTVVTAGWIKGLIRHLQDNKEIGIIGPITNNIGNEAKVSTGYDRLEDMPAEAAQMTRARMGEWFEINTLAFFFCVMFPRSTYEQIGGLCEEYGLGFFEDDDYCRRVQRRGMRAACAEDVFVHHHLSASFDTLGAKKKTGTFRKEPGDLRKQVGILGPAHLPRRISTLFAWHRGAEQPRRYFAQIQPEIRSGVVGFTGECGGRRIRFFSTLELASMNSGTRTILLSLAGLAALTVFTRKPPIILCLGLLACLSIVCAQIWPVMVVAVFALSSTVLGRWLLRQDALDDWSVHLLVGAGTFGTLTGLAAYLPINYPWLYGALLLLPLVLGHRHVTSIGRELLRQIRASRSAQTPLQTGFDVLICSFACLYVLVAFMPEVGHDALAMHLFVPSHLAQQHQWKFDANTYVWAVMPMLADWIYSIVYMLAGETASRLSNSAFTLLLAWQIRNMTLWAGGSATSARWASLIFLSTPLAFAESSSLHIESAWTAFMMAGTLAILKVSSFTPEPRERLSQLLLAGLLLGFAMATKAVTLSVLPVLLVILLLHYKAWAVPGIVKTLLLGSAGLILAGATPYVSAEYLTGNPVFPFFSMPFSIRRSGRTSTSNHRPFFGTGVTWDTLYRMVFKSPQFIEGRVGAAGFQWLLLPTAAVAVLLSGNKKALCILLVGAGAMFMTFHSTAYLRYVFPSFALFSVILALPFFRRQDLPAQPRHRGRCRVDPDQYPFHPGRDLLWRNQTLCTVEHDRSGCLSIGTPAHPKKMVDTVNALNTGHQPVAVFASPLMAGLHGDALYASWYNLKWKKRVRRGGLAIRTCPALAPAPGELAGDRPQVPSPGTTRSAAHGVHVVCQTG